MTLQRPPGTCTTRRDLPYPQEAHSQWQRGREEGCTQGALKETAETRHSGPWRALVLSGGLTPGLPRWQALSTKRTKAGRQNASTLGLSRNCSHGNSPIFQASLSPLLHAAFLDSLCWQDTCFLYSPGHDSRASLKVESMGPWHRLHVTL